MQPEHERRDPSYIKGIVMQEVSAQLKPLADKIDSMHDWQLGFWSNGSGRPKGFFQRRMEEDDKRNTMLEDFVQTAKQRQIEAEARKAQDEKRWQFWWPIIKWAGTGLGSALIALSVWLGPRAAKVGIILWQDYLKYHPSAADQIKSVSSEPVPGIQSSQPAPQTAGDKITGTP